MRGEEESSTALRILRARFLAEFTLSTQSEILRFAQDDSEGLGMTAFKRFHIDSVGAALVAAPRADRHLTLQGRLASRPC